MPRSEEIHANPSTGSRRSGNRGWLGEVAAIEAGLAAAEQELAAMRDLATPHTTVHLGMPDFLCKSASRWAGFRTRPGGWCAHT
ncbi:hypothetical protein ACFWP8_34590, partial [Streptomyces anulatus]